MAHLTLAGLSDDGSRLLLVDDNGAEFTLDVDAPLRATLRGEHARIGQLEIQMDSALRPRDIQTRIRGGETPESVAQAAQAPIEKIMVFAAPVLAERAHVAQRAQASSLRRKAGDTGARTLGEAVSAHLHSLQRRPRRGRVGRVAARGRPLDPHRRVPHPAAQGQGDLRLRHARQLRHLRGRGRPLAGRRRRQPPRGARRRSGASRRPPAGPRAPAQRRTRRRAAAGRGRHRAGQRRREAVEASPTETTIEITEPAELRARRRHRPGPRRRRGADDRPSTPTPRGTSTTPPRTSRRRGAPRARPAAARRCRAGTRSCSAARATERRVRLTGLNIHPVKSMAIRPVTVGRRGARRTRGRPDLGRRRR